MSSVKLKEVTSDWEDWKINHIISGGAKNLAYEIKPFALCILLALSIVRVSELMLDGCLVKKEYR